LKKQLELESNFKKLDKIIIMEEMEVAIGVGSRSSFFF
jgi:hypothetical protein